jgi:hypothetical protein
LRVELLQQVCGHAVQLLQQRDVHALQGATRASAAAQ